MKYSFAQADEILPKINKFKQLRTQAGTCFLPRVNCDVAVMLRIPPSNGSPTFELSAIFLL